jgi:putative phosphonate catabolism associated alcohol dehydrogenase
MKTSKYAYFDNTTCELKIDSVVIPSLQEGEILVEISYTTLCKSDILTYTRKRLEKNPTILGHESCGTIVAVGKNTPLYDARNTKLQIGDLITWGIFSSDPTDKMSIRGIPQKAANLFKYGHEQIAPTNHLHGGLSEYIILRPNTPIVKLLVKIPLPVIAIINCAVATAAGAIRTAENIEGKNILIAGTGMLGVLACAIAKRKGAKNIIAVDIDSDRLLRSKSFGATHKIHLDTIASMQSFSNWLFVNKISIDCFFDFSGEPTTIDLILNQLSVGGIAIFIGSTYPQQNITLNAEKIVRNIWTIKGLHNYNIEDLIEAVRFIESEYRNYPLETLIKGGFNLDNCALAFEYAIKEHPYRVGISIKKY